MEEQHLLLLHGLGRSKYSMSILGWTLGNSYSSVHNLGYRSRVMGIGELSNDLELQLKRTCPEGSTLSAVVHSLGGILLRGLIASTADFYRWKRVVMLGTPNRGAAVARFVRQLPAIPRFFGPALAELAEATWEELNAEILDGCEIGILAGGTGTERGFVPFFGSDNDGLVTVEETRLRCSTDHLVVPIPHFLLMVHPRAIRLTKTFLESGSFGSRSL